VTADRIEHADELLDVLASTRAIRRYRDEPVPDADLARILFAATRAPSGSNRQPFRFLVLREGAVADQAKALMTGLLPPKLVEKISGYAEVRELFTIPKMGVVAGCFVPDGVIRRSNQIRVVRNGTHTSASEMKRLAVSLTAGQNRHRPCCKYRTHHNR